MFDATNGDSTMYVYRKTTQGFEVWYCSRYTGDLRELVDTLRTKRAALALIEQMSARSVESYASQRGDSRS